MGIYRLYSDKDGHSHIDEIDLAGHPVEDGEHQLGPPQAATNIVFRETSPGNFADWHPAPRRQYVIVLEGELEIGLSDGTTQRFGPGDARLVEDTTGRGHTTRVSSSVPCVTAVVPLAA